MCKVFSGFLQHFFRQINANYFGRAPICSKRCCTHTCTAAYIQDPVKFFVTDTIDQIDGRLQSFFTETVINISIPHSCINSSLYNYSSDIENLSAYRFPYEFGLYQWVCPVIWKSIGKVNPFYLTVQLRLKGVYFCIVQHSIGFSNFICFGN